MLLASSRWLAGLVLAALALLLPAEAGTFKNPALIDTTYDPIGVASADFNHDGKLDLVYIDSFATPTLHVLLGNGDGTFSHGQDIGLPAGACGYANCAINLKDVTQDGNLDIIVGNGTLDIYGNSTAKLAVLTGNSDGTFNPPIISAVPNLPGLNGQMAIGDVNGDGAMDIVAVSGYYLDIFLGNNWGKFTLKASLTLYFGGATTVYLRDINGDGHLDIVANDLLGARTFVLLGNGDGTFQPFVSYNSTYAWLFADMDGDGHPDLVGAAYGQGVVISKANPDGTFAAPVSVANLPPGGSLLTVADYNGDGIPDLVFSTPVGIAVALGQGNLTYAAPVSTVGGSTATPFLALAELAPADFNGDGHEDLAMGVDGGVLILLGNGDGSFASADYYDVGHSVGVGSVADFNGDGKPDVAVTVPATYPRLLLGTGSGTFNLGPDQNQSYNSQTPAGTLAVADFNGDGKPDLIYGQSFVLFNAGNGTFSSPLAINAGPTLVADVNNDGRSDLVFNSNAGITVMLGQANSTFATVNTALWAGGIVAAVGDLNNDGKADLLTFEGFGIRLWLGNGDGTFTHSSFVPFPAGFYAQSATIKDLDGDGNADILVVPDSNPAAPLGPILILYGNGDGTFQPPSFIPLSHRYSLLALEDVNRDNKLDLVLTDGSGIAVITNLGNRTFSPEDHYVAGQGINQVNVVDVNGDGFPDIVVANSGGSTVTVLLNQPNGTPLDGLPSVGALTVTPAPSNYSQPVALKIIMSAAAGGVVPSGSVTFYVDGGFIADVPLVAGMASYAFSQILTPGTHTFVAAYNGDSTYSAESFAVVQTVNPPVYPTQTALTASPKTVLASQTVRLTATVTSSVPVPGGVVTFMDGTNSLGGQQVDSSGVALLDTATLTAGTHPISAVYQGYQDPYNLHAVFQTSTSAPVTVTVNTVPTSTGISASSSSPTSGSVVTFTASITSVSATPFGGVSFYDGGSLLGTVSLVAGTATFSTASLSMGSHTITAVFNANSTFGSSSSPALNISVAAASGALAKSLVLVNLQNNSGAAVLSALVANPRAAGKVLFLDSGKILGAALTDVSGRANLTVPTLSGGVHNFSASYAGNSQFAPAVSPPMMEQWPGSGPRFAMELSGESLSVQGAHSERLPMTIVPIGNFQQSVRLSCVSELPDGYSCDFSPPAFTGGGTTYLSLRPPGRLPGNSRTSLPAYGIAGLFAFVLARKKDRRLRRLLIVLMTLNLLSLGCGNNPRFPAPQPQAQVISIRATSGAGSGLILHSAQVLIKVYPQP